MISSFTLKFLLKQDHAKTEEPVRYANRNTLQVYMDLHLKGRASQAMMALTLMIQLLKVIELVLVVQQLP